MLSSLLPAGFAVVELAHDPIDAVLLPAEQEAVANAVPHRWAEYATVRHCARQALAQLGHPPAAIVRGAAGAPVWPAGVVGAMTHCAGYRGAALALAATAGGVGIDAEQHAPLPDGVLTLVSDAAERDHLDQLSRQDPSVSWDRLLFSAKESVYKLWYPLAERWLGFEEASVRFAPATQTFTATVHQAAVHSGYDLATVVGRYGVTDEHVFTAVAVLR